MATVSEAEWSAVDRRLWFGLLLGPLAAGINTIVGYTVAHYACEVNHKATLYGVTALDIFLCLCGVLLANSTRSQLTEGGDQALHHERRIFLLHLATALCLLCLILTIAGTLAVVILDPCD